jgi:hypothetical protein
MMRLSLGVKKYHIKISKTCLSLMKTIEIRKSSKEISKRLRKSTKERLNLDI